MHIAVSLYVFHDVCIRTMSNTKRITAADAADILRTATGALNELLVAWEYSSIDQQPWIYAVSIDTLRIKGMREADIRWLLSKGFAIACHGSGQSQKVRQQKRIGSQLSATTRIILTRLGVAFLLDHELCNAAKDVQSNSERPYWDMNTRRLRFGKSIIKQFSLPAPNQEAILRAFQEQNWPDRIADPLPPLPMGDSLRRLQDTIRSLNGHMRAPIIRFHGDGTGKGVIWTIDDNPGTSVRSPVERRVDNANECDPIGMLPALRGPKIRRVSRLKAR